MASHDHHHEGEDDWGEHHHPGPASETAATPDSVDGAVPHLHFHWFGFHITLPDFKPPAQDGDDFGGEQLVWVRPPEDLGPLPPSGAGIERPLVLVGQKLAVHELAELCTVSGWFDTVSGTLLCDRARHERSGVQLS